MDQVNAEAAFAAFGYQLSQLRGFILVDLKGFAGVFDFDEERIVLPVNRNFDRGVVITLVLMDDAIGTSLIGSQDNLIGDYARHFQICQPGLYKFPD